MSEGVKTQWGPREKKRIKKNNTHRTIPQDKNKKRDKHGVSFIR